MNEHIHIDGDAVIVYGQRLTLDEARAAERALRDAVALADSLAQGARERGYRDGRRRELLDMGWERSNEPNVLVRLIPGREWDVRNLSGQPVHHVTHRSVPVRVYGGGPAHVATGAPYCDCGTFVHYETVLPAGHGLPMCRAHRGAP